MVWRAWMVQRGEQGWLWHQWRFMFYWAEVPDLPSLPCGGQSGMDGDVNPLIL